MFSHLFIVAVASGFTILNHHDGEVYILHTTCQTTHSVAQFLVQEGIVALESYGDASYEGTFEHLMESLDIHW